MKLGYFKNIELKCYPYDARRGSRARRLRENRVRRRPSRCVADAVGPADVEAKAPVKVLDLSMRVRCRGCGAQGRSVVLVIWGRQNA